MKAKKDGFGQVTLSRPAFISYKKWEREVASWLAAGWEVRWGNVVHLEKK